jgi:hypothetical protein
MDFEGDDDQVDLMDHDDDCTNILYFMNFKNHTFTRAETKDYDLHLFGNNEFVFHSLFCSRFAKAGCYLPSEACKKAAAEAAAPAALPAAANQPSGRRARRRGESLRRSAINDLLDSILRQFALKVQEDCI